MKFGLNWGILRRAAACLVAAGVADDAARAQLIVARDVDVAMHPQVRLRGQLVQARGVGGRSRPSLPYASSTERSDGAMWLMTTVRAVEGLRQFARQPGFLLRVEHGRIGRAQLAKAHVGQADALVVVHHGFRVAHGGLARVVAQQAKIRPQGGAEEAHLALPEGSSMMCVPQSRKWTLGVAAQALCSSWRTLSRWWP